MNVAVVKLNSDRALSMVRTVLHWNFSDSVNYSEMSTDDYQEKVAYAQDHLNEQGIGAIIAWNMREEIANYCGSQHVMIQSAVYLRAARPGLSNDVVGWHREAFYGAPADAVNLWMPVMNVNADNTLRYIPDSDMISDDNIETVTDEVPWQRGSAGHKIGLLYAPKRITKMHGNAEFARDSQPMLVPDGSVALFSGALIHGAAVNLSNKIRFSVDLRLLARGT